MAYYINLSSRQQNIWLGSVSRQKTENNLNDLGSFPILSTLSGLARVVIFSSQTVIDTSKAIYFLALSIFSSSGNDLYSSSVLVLHDLSNLLRGVIEMIPLIGNMIVFFYDRKGSRFEYFQNDFLDVNKSPLDLLVQDYKKAGKHLKFSNSTEIEEYLHRKELSINFLKESIEKKIRQFLTENYFWISIKHDNLKIEAMHSEDLYKKGGLR